MSSPLAINHNNTGTHLPRPKLTTTVWEDESTVCYQVDAKGVCVARRQDNDMINGTKLLNVVGMSRGKRDGILKNEKGRVVVKVGAMHLKGVWITFERARDLATKFKIADILYPLFIDNPAVFLPNAQNCNSSNHSLLSSNPSSLINKVYTNNLNNNNNTNNFSSFNMQSWDKHYSSPSLPSIHHASQDQMLIRTQPNENGSCSPVPGTIAPILPANDQNDLYLINPYNKNTRYNSTHSSTYSLYDHPNPTFPTTSSLHTSPYVQHRKMAHKEQRRNSLDFPSSPPPENAKYNALYSLDSHQHSWSETTNNPSHETEESSFNKTSPLVRHMKELGDVQDKTSRKRMHQDNTCQEHKRIRNDKIIASP